METAIPGWRTAASVVLWLVFTVLLAGVLALTIAFAMGNGGYSLLFIAHIAGGTVFLGLGALQFLARVRDRYRRFHRVNGRIMLVAAVVSIGALYAMLPNSQCNACLPSQIAVTTLWLVSIVAAWLAIRRGDVAAHRLHMARGFVAASYFLLVRLMDQVVGVDRLLPFVTDQAARLANSDWMVWVIPVLLVEVVMRATAPGASSKAPAVRSALLIALLAPIPLAAQGGPAIGAFAGVGSGPIDAAAWGVEAAVPLWRGLALDGELSGWGNGFGDAACVALPPESHRCSVSGRAGLVGVGLTVPARGGLAAFGGVSGGRFRRDWIGDERVDSAAVSVKGGIAVQLHGPLQARFGGRFLRVFDEDYQSLVGDELQYVMGTFGVLVRFGW